MVGHKRERVLGRVGRAVNAAARDFAAGIHPQDAGACAGACAGDRLHTAIAEKGREQKVPGLRYNVRFQARF